MKILHFIIICSLLLHLSCGENSGTSSNHDLQTLISPEENSLKENDIFDMHAVWPYINLGKNLPKNSTQNFLRGIDHLKNTKDFDSAIFLLRESIFSYPSLKAYFELGNAYFENGSFENALKSYQMAERLGYEPFGDALFQMAKIYSINDSLDVSGHFLECAIQAGYLNMDAIAKDTSLNNLRKDSYYYNLHLERGLRGLNNPEKLVWLQYKKSYPILTVPVFLNQNFGHEILARAQFIPYTYETYVSEMRDEKFSREISKGFYYCGQISESEKYTALVYITKDEFMSGKAPLAFTVVTYNSEGKLIDKKQISELAYYDNSLKEAKFTSSTNFEIDSYKLELSDEEDENGFNSFKITSKTNVGKEKYSINENGKIVKLKNRVALL